MLHYSLLILLAQSSTQTSADFTSFSLSVLLSVTVSVSSLSICLYASFLFNHLRSSSPPSLWAPGRSVGLSEEKHRFK